MYICVKELLVALQPRKFIATCIRVTLILALLRFITASAKRVNIARGRLNISPKLHVIQRNFRCSRQIKNLEPKLLNQVFNYREIFKIRLNCVNFLCIMSD